MIHREADVPLLVTGREAGALNGAGLTIFLPSHVLVRTASSMKRFPAEDFALRTNQVVAVIAVEQALIGLRAGSGVDGLTHGKTALYVPVPRNRGTGRGKTNKKREFCRRTLAGIGWPEWNDFRFCPVRR